MNMKTVHILVAEDDPNIRMGLVDTLESEGYRVTAADNGLDAVALAESQTFDLVLLDVMMPGKSGYDVCCDIRGKNNQVPVIMLTAKGEEIDKVVGLRLGADDYMTKPFGIHELLARITAVLRRCARKSEPLPDDSFPTICFGGHTLDVKRFRLVTGTRETDVTEREIRLIRLFCDHPEEVLSRDYILNQVWGIDYLGTTRTLDQHIALLRKKIETDPANPQIITTVHGVGYRYRAC